MGKRALVFRMVVAVPLLAAALAVGAPTPAAAAYSCTGTVTGVTIKESVVVPDGASCTFENVVVRGGVTVGTNGYFRAYGFEIRGPVSGTNAFFVSIQNGVVRGSVTVAGSGAASVFEVEVRGDVVLTDLVSYAQFSYSTTRGQAILDRNTTVYVPGNTIETDLSCTGNGTVTNEGFPNTAGGAKLGQCAGL